MSSREGSLEGSPWLCHGQENMLVLLSTQGNCFLLSSQTQKVMLGWTRPFLALSALQLLCLSAGSVQSSGSRVCLHVALQALMNIPRAELLAPREENLVIQGDGCGGVFQAPRGRASLWVWMPGLQRCLGRRFCSKISGEFRGFESHHPTARTLGVSLFSASLVLLL